MSTHLQDTDWARFFLQHGRAVDEADEQVLARMGVTHMLVRSSAEQSGELDAQRAADPNTPPEQLRELARHHYDLVEANVALPVIQLADPFEHAGILWSCARGRMFDAHNKHIFSVRRRRRLVEKIAEHITGTLGLEVPTSWAEELRPEKRGNINLEGAEQHLCNVMVFAAAPHLGQTQSWWTDTKALDAWIEYHRVHLRLIEAVGAELGPRRRGERRSSVAKGGL